MAAPAILVPYNFTKIDQKAITFTVQIFGRQPVAKLTLFHTYVPIPQIETPSSTVMGRLSSGMHYLQIDLKEKEETIKQERAKLLDIGFPEHQVDYVFKPRSKQVAEEIIDAAAAGQYTVIVLSYRPYRITRAFVQSVHNKVITALRDVAVCIVT